jgi:uncharacterized protein with HEPN domain
VLDIIEAVGNIKRRLPDHIEQFRSDELIQVWIVHHLWIIGEAANALTSEVRARHPALPWSDIIGMRHMLIHQYFRRDVQTVWDTATQDLAVLDATMQRELEQMPDDA